MGSMVDDSTLIQTEAEVARITGHDLLFLVHKNGALEESIARNAKSIDENTKKAEELERKIIRLNLEYDTLTKQVEELDGTVHKGTQTAQPLTQQVAVMKSEFTSMKKILYFIATMSATAVIQLILTIVEFVGRKGV